MVDVAFAGRTAPPKTVLDVQILTDMATRLGPALGWQPAAGPETGTGT